MSPAPCDPLTAALLWWGTDLLVWLTLGALGLATTAGGR